VLLLIACYQDYRENKIRNWLVFAGLCWGIYMQFADKGMIGILDFAEGCLAVFLMMYPLFKLGMIGAGDIKLFAVCTGAIGVNRGVCFLCVTFLVAAVLALLKMLHQRIFFQRFRYFFTYLGQTVRTAELTIYGSNDTGQKKSRICLAGPACLAVLLCLGGVY